MKAGYLIIIFAAFTAACTPRFYPPRVSVPDDYIYGRGFSEDTTRFGPEWWTLFGDTVLNNLVARALDNNRDVAVAASRVEEARLNLKSVRAQYLPQVGLGVTAEGEYTPATKIVQSYAVEPVALVGGGALRAAAQCQTRRKSPDSLVGVGAAGRTAGAGGRSRHDLFHPARI